MSKLCRFFLLSILFFCLFACKKDSTGEGAHDKYYHIRFKLDGVQKEYKINAKIQFAKNPAEYMIATVDDAMPVRERIQLHIFGISYLTIPFNYHVATSPNEGGSMTFTQDQRFIYRTLYNSKSPSDLDFKFQLSEKTDQYAKGTFSGTAFDTANLPSPKKISITEGTFYLEIKK